MKMKRSKIICIKLYLYKILLDLRVQKTFLSLKRESNQIRMILMVLFQDREVDIFLQLKMKTNSRDLVLKKLVLTITVFQWVN